MTPHWDNPEPGVYEAHVDRTRSAFLEVFDPLDEEDGQFQWWAFSEGRRLGSGYAPSLEEAQRQCLLAAA